MEGYRDEAAPAKAEIERVIVRSTAPGTMIAAFVFFALWSVGALTAGFAVPYEERIDCRRTVGESDAVCTLKRSFVLRTTRREFPGSSITRVSAPVASGERAKKTIDLDVDVGCDRIVLKDWAPDAAASNTRLANFERFLHDPSVAEFSCTASNGNPVVPLTLVAIFASGMVIWVLRRDELVFDHLARTLTIRSRRWPMPTSIERMPIEQVRSAFVFDNFLKGKMRRVGVDLVLDDGANVALLRGGALGSWDVEHRRQIVEEITRILTKMKPQSNPPAPSPSPERARQTGPGG